LESIIDENKDDPRRGLWLMDLGQTYLMDPSIPNRQQKAMESYLRAGEIGFGQGYSRLAEIHLHDQNRSEARKYYRLAAEKKDVNAIDVIGTEARAGYFLLANRVSVQPPSRWRTPDLKEAYQWLRKEHHWRMQVAARVWAATF
jgi:TPR repeat protein